MKNDKEKMNLEQLLDTLEHAGRDSRRQQELGAMIDSLAAAEKAPKHGFRWWSLRVAAAACVTFFVTTAIRIWFIPTGPANSSPIVAELTKQDKPSVLSEDTTINPAVIVPTIKHPTQRHTTYVTAESEPVAAAEMLAEETVTPETLQADDTTETESAELPYYIVEDDFAPDTELIVDNDEPEQNTTLEPVVNQPVAAKPAKSQHRKILGGFLRRSEPSRMEGTTLALLQF